MSAVATLSSIDGSHRAIEPYVPNSIAGYHAFLKAKVCHKALPNHRVTPVLTGARPFYTEIILLPHHHEAPGPISQAIELCSIRRSLTPAAVAAASGLTRSTKAFCSATSE